MKWLKYRQIWKSGPKDWFYRPLFENRLTAALKSSVRAQVDRMAMDEARTRKFLDFEWYIVDSARVPKARMQRLIAALGDSVKAYKAAAKDEFRKQLQVIGDLHKGMADDSDATQEMGLATRGRRNTVR